MSRNSFLRDENGALVTTTDGLPILRKVLDKSRKPNPCQGCNFSKWCVGDSAYLIQRPEGGMEWLCSNCALDRGLPLGYYHRNKYAPKPAQLAKEEGANASCFGWKHVAQTYFCHYSA